MTTENTHYTLKCQLHRNATFCYSNTHDTNSQRNDSVVMSDGELHYNWLVLHGASLENFGSHLIYHDHSVSLFQTMVSPHIVQWYNRISFSIAYVKGQIMPSFEYLCLSLLMHWVMLSYWALIQLLYLYYPFLNYEESVLDIPGLVEPIFSFPKIPEFLYTEPQ